MRSHPPPPDIWPSGDPEGEDEEGDIYDIVEEVIQTPGQCVVTAVTSMHALHQLYLHTMSICLTPPLVHIVCACLTPAHIIIMSICCYVCPFLYITLGYTPCEAVLAPPMPPDLLSSGENKEDHLLYDTAAAEEELPVLPSPFHAQSPQVRRLALLFSAETGN